MNKEDFFNLEYNDIVYNNNTKQVAYMTSYYANSAKIEDITPESSLGVVSINGEYMSGLSCEEAEHFESSMHDDILPDWVRIVLLEYRLNELDMFVRERLR